MEALRENQEYRVQGDYLDLLAMQERGVLEESGDKLDPLVQLESLEHQEVEECLALMDLKE